MLPWSLLLDGVLSISHWMSGAGVVAGREELAVWLDELRWAPSNALQQPGPALSLLALWGD